MKKFILLLLILLLLTVILSGCIEEQNKKKLEQLLLTVFFIYLLIGCIRGLYDYGFNPFNMPYEERGWAWVRMVFWPITVSDDIYKWCLRRKRRKENSQKISEDNKDSNR